MTTEEIQQAAQAASKLQEDRQMLWAEIKALRLDAPDAYNISDAITAKDYLTYNVTGTKYSIISPRGCHYSKNHVMYLMQSENKYTFDGALNILSKTDTYANPDPIIEKDLDLTSTGLQKWIEEQGIQIDNSTKNVAATVDQNSSGDSSYSKPLTEEQKAAAQQQRQPEPSDVISQKPTPDNNTVVFEGEKYVEWLCEAFNGVCRSDSNKPQIPTSIAVSIALARTGFSNATIGQFNFWKLPYDKTLTTLAEDEGLCAFSNETKGTQACISILRRNNFTTALTGLEEDMTKTTEENKVKVTKAILNVLSQTPDDDYKTVESCVQKYKLRDWDTDKKVSEGGHADQTTTNNSKAQKNGTGKTVTKAIARVASILGNKGNGFEITPMGADTVKVTKLPKGKTLCEPVYPDLVTVGDSVPEWIYSETYAQIAEQAEADAFAAVGISLTEEDSNSAAIDAFNSELATFQDKQFAQWCSDTSVTYSTESEKNAALEKYKQAIITDPEHFKDGIYIPDSTAEEKYNQLLNKKKQIVANSSITSQVYNQFQSSLSKVTTEIQNREGSWNQDKGAALTSVSTTTSTNNSTVSNPNANIEKMVQWAINIAEDQTHGYSQANRTGPDYDCSSFVYYALENAGFKVVTARGYAGTAETIWEDLQSLTGWQKYDWDTVKASLVRGDILNNPDRHSAIYIGNLKTVEAHGVSRGSSETGDQGEEIDYGGIEGRNFTEVYRYTGGKS